MFTGLIQQVGRLERLERAAGGWRLWLTHAPWPEALVPGESVAVQGACLTVLAPAPGRFAADMLDETRARTAFSRLAPGAAVNLERALRLGDRLGGHWVTGHVDETGSVAALEPRGRDWALRIACSPELARLTVHKGSITLDGVSLTVTEVGERHVAVHLIPHTWRETSLHELRPGDPVNLESDILGKHVARLLAAAPATASPAAALSLSDLLDAGFAP
jgi:riboflavin synthase